eukprot:3381886-Amphidinium_carterae.1
MARDASVNSVSVAYGLRLHARMTEPENIITTDVVPKSVSFRDMAWCSAHHDHDDDDDDENVELGN